MVIGTDPNKLWPGNVEPRVGYDIGNGMALDAKSGRILFHTPEPRKEYWIENDDEGNAELKSRNLEWWEK